MSFFLYTTGPERVKMHMKTIHKGNIMITLAAINIKTAHTEAVI
jgi:hypothetical protein